MISHYITIHSGGGSDKKVSIKTYINAIKTAKANPDTTFAEGLCQWWPVKGCQIYKDYVKSIYERMWEKAGESWRNYPTKEEGKEFQDARRVNSRIIVRNRFESKSANKKLKHLLYTNDDF